nr:MAG TPA: hypothetical protein [Caudoviricetes sp.]
MAEGFLFGIGVWLAKFFVDILIYLLGIVGIIVFVFILILIDNWRNK